MAQPRKIQDRFFKMAKADGYLARSAYKLQEIHAKFRIINRGDHVLDLGCAPGSWLQVASEFVGEEGSAVGIDVLDVRHHVAPNVRTMKGDVFAVTPADLFELGGGIFDTVLSDMAPNTTGHGDDFLSARLCLRVLEVLPTLLKPGGCLAMKIFEGEDTPNVMYRARKVFRQVNAFKPRSSRDVSRETFIVAKGFRASEARETGPTPTGAASDTPPGSA